MSIFEGLGGRLISTLRLGWLWRLGHRHAVTQDLALGAQLLAERLFGLAGKFIAGHQFPNAIKPLAQIVIGKLVGGRRILKIDLGLGFGCRNCRIAIQLLGLLGIAGRCGGRRLRLGDRRLFTGGGLFHTTGVSRGCGRPASAVSGCGAGTVWAAVSRAINSSRAALAISANCAFVSSGNLLCLGELARRLETVVQFLGAEFAERTLIVQKIGHIGWKFRSRRGGRFGGLFGRRFNGRLFGNGWRCGLFGRCFYCRLFGNGWRCGRFCCSRLGCLLFAGGYFGARRLGHGLQLVTRLGRETFHFGEIAGLLGAGAELFELKAR